MEHIPKSKFRPRALEYLRHVEETGQELIITDHGKPVLKITRYQPVPAAKAVGLERLRGSVIRYDDPFEPLGPEGWNAKK